MWRSPGTLDHSVCVCVAEKCVSRAGCFINCPHTGNRCGVYVCLKQWPLTLQLSLGKFLSPGRTPAHTHTHILTPSSGCSELSACMYLLIKIRISFIDHDTWTHTSMTLGRWKPTHFRFGKIVEPRWFLQHTQYCWVRSRGAIPKGWGHIPGGHHCWFSGYWVWFSPTLHAASCLSECLWSDDRWDLVLWAGS